MDVRTSVSTRCRIGSQLGRMISTKTALRAGLQIEQQQPASRRSGRRCEQASARRGHEPRSSSGPISGRGATGDLVREQIPETTGNESGWYAQPHALERSTRLPGLAHRSDSDRSPWSRRRTTEGPGHRFPAPAGSPSCPCRRAGPSRGGVRRFRVISVSALADADLSSCEVSHRSLRCATVPVRHRRASDLCAPHCGFHRLQEALCPLAVSLGHARDGIMIAAGYLDACARRVVRRVRVSKMLRNCQ